MKKKNTSNRTQGKNMVLVTKYGTYPIAQGVHLEMTEHGESIPIQTKVNKPSMIHISNDPQDAFASLILLDMPREMKKHLIIGGLESRMTKNEIKQYKRLKKRITGNIDNVLTSEEINDLLQSHKHLSKMEDYGLVAGYFTTRLMTNAHRTRLANLLTNIKTVDSFRLDTQHVPGIEGLGYNLCGKHKKRVRVDVSGNIGKLAFAGSKYCKVICDSAGDELGAQSNFCGFGVYGDVGNYCGAGARDSEFYIRGDVGRCLGLTSENCVFVLHGAIDSLGGGFMNDGKLTRNLTIKTPNRDTLDKILKYVNKGLSAVNKEEVTVKFIHDDGEDMVYPRIIKSRKRRT